MASPSTVEVRLRLADAVLAVVGQTVQAVSELLRALDEARELSLRDAEIRALLSSR
ncbi:MAG: hypothetical protein U0166_16145 [Acidobacteriota bacterium]